MRSNEEMQEGLEQRKLLKEMLKLSKDKELAIEITISGDKKYSVGHNAFVKHLLKKELNEVNKFIKGKRNKWE